MAQLWTIGHSNHERDHFLGLLEGAGIEVLVDVRSHPHSRYVPWANRQPLAGALRSRGISYLFLGAELGGRPRDPAAYDDEGHVLYDRVCHEPDFLRAAERLRGGLESYRVAVMCSEENPDGCHRRLLVARHLLEAGDLTVHHIRGDGSTEQETELAGAAQRDWRSVKPIRR
jgi:uncharacterized protein (DUF488 family)